MPGMNASVLPCCSSNPGTPTPPASAPAGWLLLQHERDALSYEQTRRYLQQWAVFQVRDH